MRRLTQQNYEPYFIMYKILVFEFHKKKYLQNQNARKRYFLNLQLLLC